MLIQGIADKTHVVGAAIVKKNMLILYKTDMLNWLTDCISNTLDRIPSRYTYVYHSNKISLTSFEITVISLHPK